LAQFVSTFSKEELLVVSRAFAHFLAIANAAEKHHINRVLEEFNVSSGGFYDKEDSCGGVLPELAEKHSAEVVWNTLVNQTVELVLTAHPTEVNRRTILDKHRRIQGVCILQKVVIICGKKSPPLIIVYFSLTRF
jgi:phosphoenolpyruvate carboxylase